MVRNYPGNYPGKTGRSSLPAFPKVLDKGEYLMSKLLAGADATMCFCGDSTGNETTEWISLLASQLGALYPKMSIDYTLWNDGTQSYAAPTVIQTGTAPSPGIVFQDNFSRVAAELYQTTPDIGAVWGRDGTNASGDWTIDGSKAVRTADATGGFVLADGGVTGDLKVTIVGTISTVGTGTAYNTQIVLKRASTTNRLLLTIAVSTAGAVTWTLSKVIGGTNSTVAASVTLTALTANTANQSFTLVVQTSGLTFSATLGASTISGTLLQADVDALALATATGIAAGASTAMTMDSYTVEQIGATTPPKLTIYNCSVAGTTLSYQQPILQSITPVAPDLAVLSTGHNYAGATPSQFEAFLDSFLSDYTNRFPAAGILITSQNPQKAPAANKAPHFTRQVYLRSYCARRQIGFVPVFEKWNATSGGGVTMIDTDGVHPTKGASSGSEFWATQVKNFLQGLVA